MPVESLNCNQCGAPLLVPEGANYLTCQHCQTPLAVRRDESVRYTEKIAELNQKTEDLSGQVAFLHYQQATADLDRNWEKQRELLLVRTRNGRRVPPSPEMSVFAGACIVGIGIIVTFGASIPEQLPLYQLMGIGMIALGLIGGWWSYEHAYAYARAEAEYRRRKSRLTVESFEQNDEPLDLPKDLPWTS